LDSNQRPFGDGDLVLLGPNPPHRWTNRRGAAPGPGEPLRRDGVLDWVHRHLGHEITAEAAARQAHVSVGAFSRWFKRKIGRTFTEYLNDVRCSAACDRLLRSDASIARIASECGFGTLSNFNAQFRRRNGCTPREFRGRA
jgi:AraC-like DNA-binding protein